MYLYSIYLGLKGGFLCVVSGLKYTLYKYMDPKGWGARHLGRHVETIWPSWRIRLCDASAEESATSSQLRLQARFRV